MCALEQQATGGSSPGEEQGEGLMGSRTGWRAEGEGGKRGYCVSKLLEEAEGETYLCPLLLVTSMSLCFLNIASLRQLQVCPTLAVPMRV